MSQSNISPGLNKPELKLTKLIKYVPNEHETYITIEAHTINEDYPGSWKLTVAIVLWTFLLLAHLFFAHYMPLR